MGWGNKYILDDAPELYFSFGGTSQPYEIVVTNNSGSTINNVQVLGAYKNLLSGNFGNPGAISISSGIPGSGYSELLQQSEDKPFLVGLTYLQSANAQQLKQSLSISDVDADGDRRDYTVTPRTDPYQSQGGAVTVGYQFKIDGNTSIVISRMLPNTSMTISLYPKRIAELDPGKGSTVESFWDPNIIRPRKVVIWRK